MAAVMLVCGSGEEPSNTIARLVKNGRDFVVVGILECGQPIDDGRFPYHEVSIGQLGTILQLANEYSISNIAFAGSFSAIQIEQIRIDEFGLKYITDKGIKPDSLHSWLGAALGALTAAKITIESLASITGSIAKIPHGWATKRKWSVDDQSDYINARRLQKAINSFKVGEVVIVRKGSIIGLEVENEGTDDVLERVKRLSTSTRSGILVKWPYIDDSGKIVSNPKPTIGLKTVKLAFEARLSGLIIHPETDIWNVDDVLEFCDQNELFVLADSEDKLITC